MSIVKAIIPAAVALLLAGCSSNSLKDGLVLYSDFEQGAADLSGNGHDGSLEGAVLTDDCAVGSHAVYFNGVDAYVSYPEDIYFEGDYSISVWCKWEDCKLWNRIMDFNQDTPMSGNALTWLIGRPARDTQNNLWFDQWVFYDGIAVESILSQRNMPADAYLEYNVTLDQWNHYVIVYDSTAENPNGLSVNSKGENVPYEGVVRLYVDGKLVGTNTHCLKPQHAATTANWLGRSRFAPDPYFKGWMDEFRIYDRCLDEAEITELYNLKK